jgi:hypothetical protein
VFKLEGRHVVAAAPVRAGVAQADMPVSAKRAIAAPRPKQIAHVGEGEWEEYSR